VRILSGDLYGRAFDQPKTDGTRPLTDKVRAAIFDVVGSPEGLTVLDAYAGTGAAGFEALSRGATQVEAIEGNRQVARVIERNIGLLKITWGYTLNKLKVETWLAMADNNPPRPRYDLIIADPPYADIDTDILSRLGAFLTADGVMVVSHASKIAAPELIDLALVRHKVYGDSALSFYKAVA
jgi:16S rRNA (guanine966-N2)-methyltransferase